jgi:hypothetical protein
LACRQSALYGRADLQRRGTGLRICGLNSDEKDKQQQKSLAPRLAHINSFLFRKSGAALPMTRLTSIYPKGERF